MYNSIPDTDEVGFICPSYREGTTRVNNVQSYPVNWSQKPDWNSGIPTLQIHRSMNMVPENMYVCINIRAYMGVYMCAFGFVCACLWRPEVDVGL